MFEASFIGLLSSDIELTDKLSTYYGQPAIFSDIVPEEVSVNDDPYLVFNIDRNDSDNLIIATFLIDIDIYGPRTKSKIIREIVERIIFTCDRAIILDDERYSSIRIYNDTSEYIHEKDSKITHYNISLEARGTRKKWAEQIVRS